MRIGITCYPSYGGSGVVATEIGKELAERGHEIHFVTYAIPIKLDATSDRIHFHEVEMMNYPLFEHPPYALALATKMADVAIHQDLDLPACPLRHPPFGERFPGKGDAQAQAASRNHHLARDRHHPGGQRSILPAHYPPLDRKERRSDGGFRISARTDRSGSSKWTVPITVIPNFVNCDVFQRSHDEILRGRHAFPEERILIHISNFRPVKRVNDVVEIFDRVQASRSRPGS